MVSENGGKVVPEVLRGLLMDHPPQAFFQREQWKIAEVWEALPELLRVYEAWQSGVVASVVSVESHGIALDRCTLKADVSSDVKPGRAVRIVAA